MRDEDLAGTLVELEQRLPREEIASALGVDERELDEIASGYPPGRDVAERLRALALGDEGVHADGGARRISARLIAVFIVADVVFFLGVALFVLAR